MGIKYNKHHIDLEPLLFEIEEYRHTIFSENTNKRITNTWYGKYEKLFYSSGCVNEYEFSKSPDAMNLIQQISKDMDMKRDYYYV